jgi:isoquinoline 1-oxidoreductase beta subunit
MANKWTRRAFLTAGAIVGGGLLLGVSVGIGIRPGHRTPKLAKFMQKDGEILVNAWLKLLPDNSIRIIVPHAEMGQGAQTALCMMLADEMDADWSSVSVEEAPAHDEYANFHIARDFILPGKVPGMVNNTVDGVFLTITQKLGMQVTGGSYSVRSTGVRGMRVAGAAAREMLINAAAAKWQVPASEIRSEKSYLFHDPSKKSEPYINFASVAASKQGPEFPTLKTPAQFNIMGNETVKRFDIPEKVNGTAKFGIDVVLPGMKYATVKTAPVFGSRLLSMDATQAENMKGVIKVIKLDDGVGVIADSYWQAKKAIEKVQLTYSKGPANDTSSETLFAQFRRDMDKAVAEGKEKDDYSHGDARAVLKQADNLIEAEYELPYLAHATMEPMNCTAWIQGQEIEIWSGLQNPLSTRMHIADAFGYEKENVKINNMYLGGGFGRRAKQDYPLQAVKLAAAVPGVPVKMIWSREEDVQQDLYRQAIVSRFKASLDAQGLPEAWENQYIDKHEPVEAPDIPYEVANKYIHYTDSVTHVPFGPWRSVDHSMHAFFTESFIDELAVAAQADPYQYRRKLLNAEPRYQTVLDTAAQMADWGRELPAGWGQGIALHASFNTVVAQVVDVDLTSGTPRVDKVYCAVDAGYAISPNGLRAQMESAIVFGLTAALYGEITIKDGAVQQSNFHDYPMLRMNTSPDIKVKIINSGEDIGGGGEPGTPPIAPALTNAIYAASGKRIRVLPIKLT